MEVLINRKSCKCTRVQNLLQKRVLEAVSLVAKGVKF